MIDTDDARKHASQVALEAGGQPARRAVMQAYADLFGSSNGRLVLDDLALAFHDRASESVNAEAATIDHPYRAYYIEGQRSVIFALRALVYEAMNGTGAFSDE